VPSAPSVGFSAVNEGTPARIALLGVQLEPERSRRISPDSIRMFLALAVLSLLPAVAQGQTSALDPPPVNANDPGILDPVVTQLLHQPYRLPATEQVTGDSELVNLVGSVKRKRAKGSRSATGAVIQNERAVTENIERSLSDLEDAASAGDFSEMRSAAQELVQFMEGTSSGFISDGFPLFHHFQGGLAPDHIPGEYRMKRLEHKGLTFIDDSGATRLYWEVTWRLMWTAAGAESDLALLEIPADVDPADRVLVNFEIYASEADECGPMSFVADAQLPGADGLPFKGLDTTWVRLRKDDIHEFSVDHGAVSSLRELGIRGWRVRPEPLARVDLIREVYNVHTQMVERDARGKALAAAGRLADFNSIGAAAPELKIWQLAHAVLAGATPAQVLAAMQQAQVAPAGVWQEWASLIENRAQLPREALELLAQEGIFPGADLQNPLGVYDFVAVMLNHEWYGLSAEQAAGAFAPPSLHGRDSQGDQQSLKLINLDAITHGMQLSDYGPALHDDLKICYNAPHGGKSLEIFSNKPLWGAPKAAELQWRAAWGLRPGAGILGQYDLFPRHRDLIQTARFTDSFGVLRRGWQYPVNVRGGDFRVDPPSSVLGRSGRPALHGLRESDGSPGLVIGSRTAGYGLAKMPSTDLRTFHPAGLVNTDTDGDLVPDALYFPSWLANPDAQGGDLILATPEWEPFLYLNPANGTVWNDPANPAAGLWGLETFGLGAALPAQSSQQVEWLRPRALGQAVWLDSGTLRAHGSLPLAMLY
jgi:hypothetical protein